MIKKILIIFVILFVSVAIFFFLEQKKTVRVKQVDVIAELAKKSKEKSIDLENVWLSESNNLEAAYRGKNIIFSTNKDVGGQLSSLQKIIKSSTIEKNVKTIDFRFNKIVLTYE